MEDCKASEHFQFSQRLFPRSVRLALMIGFRGFYSIFEFLDKLKRGLELELLLIGVKMIG